MADGGHNKEDRESSDDEEVDMLLRKFAASMGLASSSSPTSDTSEPGKTSPVLKEVTVQGVVDYIQERQCKNVIVLAGAGISTSAGIPDFRSAGTGLYHNLQQYNLPYPMAIFEIDFFLQNPKPFFVLSKELFPKGLLKPTPCHYFIRMLHDKGMLLRLYTQNIDTLERLAGVPGEKIVEAHGTFNSSHCLKCKKEYDLPWLKEQVMSDKIPTCDQCQNVVKPDIVFFGENLPPRFYKLLAQDFPKCDMLIVMGTSLVVQPFASLITRVPKRCPRLLINKEKAGEANPLMAALGMADGMMFDEGAKNKRDVSLLGLCDDGCLQLAAMLGWQDEMKTLIETEVAKLEEDHQTTAQKL